ncbi:hypothetical protein [Lentzea guizhouensis]|nr:hypothetical protein [Lentzea guizhouensis]
MRVRAATGVPAADRAEVRARRVRGRRLELSDAEALVARDPADLA